MTTRRYTVSGEVQGVGFRWSAQREGARLGLVGSVRNLPDGRVEAVAQGDDAALQRFEAWLHRGPRWATVRGVHAEDVERIEGSGFTIGR